MPACPTPPELDDNFLQATAHDPKELDGIFLEATAHDPKDSQHSTRW